MSCHYDRDAAAYIDDHGEECRRDYDGNPTRHCTARRSCGVHIGIDEQTCPRCKGRARANLRRIPLLAALLEPVAATQGVNSEAANLAGPAADPESWTWHRVAARKRLAALHLHGATWDEDAFAAALDRLDEDDDRHPFTLLGRWDMMIREDYGHHSSTPVTVANAAAYLDRQLDRIADDPGQDFPLFAREIRRCRRHLEQVIALVAQPQRGEPCPTCADDPTRETDTGKPRPTPRLVREYPHWCDDEDCCREHVTDESADIWRCPENPRHEWSHAAYTAYVEQRRGA